MSRDSNSTGEAIVKFLEQVATQIEKNKKKSEATPTDSRNSSKSRTQSADELATQVAELMARTNTALLPILEGVKGYKAQCIKAGFSELAADAMCADYHTAVFKMLTTDSE